jgi:hypothetical protein
MRDRDVEEPVLGQDPGFCQLVLALVAASPRVLGHELLVGERSLRVPVEQLTPRVRGCGVQGPPVLLHVLTVVALPVRQTEPALLEPVVPLVPQRDRQVQEAVSVAQARDAVLTPPVCAGVALVEGKVAPGIAIRGVVLPDGAPLAAGLVRAPQPPWRIRRKVSDPRTLRPTIASGGRTTMTLVGGYGLLLDRPDDTFSA